MRYLALAVLAALLAGGAWYLSSSDSAPEIPRDLPVLDDSARASDGDIAELSAVPVLPESADSRATLKVPGQSSGSLEASHPWSKQLASITGRLLEADGSPAGDQHVTLMEFDVDALTVAGSAAVPRGGLDVGSARTGSDGRFTIGDARGTGVHILSIAPGEPRAALRLVDQSLECGTVTDVGDFRLGEFGTVFGRVLNEAGAPVAGARVRFTEMLTPLLGPEAREFLVHSSALALRGDSLVSMGAGGKAAVVDAPRWVMDLVDRLPCATGRTGADGTFRIEGVAVGYLSGGADLAGFVPHVVEAFALKAGQEHDLGDLQLAPGRTIRGRVVDSQGAAVVGVPVFAGVAPAPMPFAVLQRAGVTGVDGVFMVSGMLETGQAIAAARRSPLDSWTVGVDSKESAGLVVQLSPAMPLKAHVVSTNGEPVEGARFQRLSGEHRYGSVSSEVAGMVAGQTAPLVTVRSTAPGQYLMDPFPEGQWWFFVSAEGFADSLEPYSHGRASGTLTVQLAPAKPLALRVVAEATGEPIEGAHLSVVGPLERRMLTLTSAWTDANGEAAVGRVPLDAPVESPGGPRSVSNFAVVVDHPHFGRWTRRLDQVKELHHDGPDGELTVRLATPGHVAGRILWANEPPPERYTLLFSQVEDITQLYRMSRTAPDGTFELHGAATGTYKVEIMRRMGDMDLITGLLASSELRVKYERTIEVRGGETTELAIALDAEGEASPGWIEGTVTLDGLPLAGAHITATEGSGRRAKVAELKTDAGGRFRTEPAESGSVTLLLSVDPSHVGEDGEKEEILSQYFRLSSSLGTVADFAIVTRSLTLVVTDRETGAALEGVTVLHGGAIGVTDAEGIAVVDIRSMESRSSRSRMVSIMLEKQGYKTQRFNDAGAMNGDRVEIKM